MFVAVHAIRVRKHFVEMKSERLVTAGNAFRISGVTYVVCRCSCGSFALYREHQITEGTAKSCKCLKAECDRNRGTHHESRGDQLTPEYRIWVGMRTRCSRTTAINYPDYGGRGIKVCERWRRSYPAFLEDMGRRPSDKHSIERKDTNGNYEPGNCEWATDVEQNNNRRSNVNLTFYGKTLTVMQWCRISGVKPATAYKRLAENLCSEKEAIWSRTLRG